MVVLVHKTMDIKAIASATRCHDSFGLEYVEMSELLPARMLWPEKWRANQMVWVPSLNSENF